MAKCKALTGSVVKGLKVIRVSQPRTLSGIELQLFAVECLKARDATVQIVTYLVRIHTSSSAIAERPRELGDFKGMGHFEAKFQVEGLLFAPTSMDR